VARATRVPRIGGPPRTGRTCRSARGHRRTPPAPYRPSEAVSRTPAHAPVGLGRHGRVRDRGDRSAATCRAPAQLRGRSPVATPAAATSAPRLRHDQRRHTRSRPVDRPGPPSVPDLPSTCSRSTARPRTARPRTRAHSGTPPEPTPSPPPRNTLRPRAARARATPPRGTAHRLLGHRPPNPAATRSAVRESVTRHPRPPIDGPRPGCRVRTPSGPRRTVGPGPQEPTASR